MEISCYVIVTDADTYQRDRDMRVVMGISSLEIAIAFLPSEFVSRASVE